VAAKRPGLTQVLELTQQMADDVSCTFCGLSARRSLIVGATWQRYECPKCGTYIATPGALHWIGESDQEVRDNLSRKASSAPDDSVLLVSDEHVWLNTQETNMVYSEYVAASSSK